MSASLNTCLHEVRVGRGACDNDDGTCPQVGEAHAHHGQDRRTMEHRESCRSLRVSIVDGERGEPAEMFNQSGAGDTGSDNADHSSRGVTGRQPPSIERGATRPFMRTTSAAIAAMINTIATRRRNAMIFRNVATVLLQPSVVHHALHQTETFVGSEVLVPDVLASIRLQAASCRRLGALHGLALSGRSPDLAARFPSCGAMARRHRLPRIGRRVARAVTAACAPGRHRRQSSP